MEVNVQKAVKMFFSNSSFEMIYSEAFANALDADANEIRINISLPDPTQIQNLNLEISDNGVGFDDCRFGKFSKLFDVEDEPDLEDLKAKKAAEKAATKKKFKLF